MSYDLAVLGSGGAAFAAAIAARRRDKSVVMVERGTVGGTCVNTGCVPSKALLAAAEARHIAGTQPFPGIQSQAGEVAFAELIGGKRALVEEMRAGKYIGLAAEYGWEIVLGRGRFVPGPGLDVELAGGGVRRVEADHYVVATGSMPWAPAVEGLAQGGYLTSTTAMELDELPESLIVVGGNYVGLEQGQLFARLGSRMTVVEILDRLAPSEEPEAGAVLGDVFTDERIAVRTATTLTRVRRDNAAVVATVRGRDGCEEELPAAAILVATGRRPMTDRLGLGAVGVEVGDRGEVIVDEYLRTTNPRVWAAGDVTGHPQFVYVAGAHGAVIADNAFDQAGRRLDYTHLPRVTFTSPAIAAVGPTERQAAEQGRDCTCRVLPLEHVPRALVIRDTRGFVKLVAERATGRLIGATIVAQNAGDAILAAVYAVKTGMTVDEMADTWCPYLTMAEGLRLAAQTFTRDISKLSCCAS